MLSAQLICHDFSVEGTGPALTIDYDAGELLHIKGVGLVFRRRWRRVTTGCFNRYLRDMVLLA